MQGFTMDLAKLDNKSKRLITKGPQPLLAKSCHHKVGSAPQACSVSLLNKTVSKGILYGEMGHLTITTK